jgi:hypothetical protein
MADFESDETAVSINDCLLKRGLRFSACAFRTGWHAVNGLKTFIACGGVALLGAYDQFGGGDLIEMLKNQFSDNAKVGSILIGVAVLFALLRFMTNSAPGGAPAASGDEGDTIK